MGYSKYPGALDNTSSLPISTDLVTPVVAEVVNRLRSAIVAVETELGADPSREFGTVRARLDDVNTLVTSLIEDVAVATSTPVAGSFNCSETISIYDMVYLSASDTVDEADASDPTKGAIGIVISKPTTTTAIVQYYGEVENPGADYTPGATLYLSETPGEITEVAPTTPGSIYQPIGSAKNKSTIMISGSPTIGITVIEDGFPLKNYLAKKVFL